MKYALVNGERREAQQGLLGQCTYCGDPTIAKCGKERIWHWAHKGKLDCDYWSKDETEWHRAWKGQFPEDWQEINHLAENGDRHRADVKTGQGYVLEFQNSPIKPGECKSRENFYKKMVWIVNGMRRSKDKDKFIDVLKHSELLDAKVGMIRLRDHLNPSALLRDWGNSKVPVFFDFSEDAIWGLLPKTIEKRAYAFRIHRNELIAYLGPALQWNFEVLLKSLDDFILGNEKLAAVLENVQRLKMNHEMNRPRRRDIPRL